LLLMETAVDDVRMVTIPFSRSVARGISGMSCVHCRGPSGWEGDRRMEGTSTAAATLLTRGLCGTSKQGGARQGRICRAMLASILTIIVPRMSLVDLSFDSDS
jgi:hypothetical protein